MPRTSLKKAIAASRFRTRTNPHSKVNSTECRMRPHSNKRAGGFAVMASRSAFGPGSPTQLLRAPDVDEDLVLHPHRLADVVQVHADRVVRLLRVERRVRVRGHVLREGQLLQEPLLASAVHEDEILDPVILEDPERER